MRKPTTILLALAAVIGWQGAGAHHSFAVFFEPEGAVSATGVVTAFNFRNPHASLEIEGVGEDGETVIWRGETNSPSLLRRRGWGRDAVAVGETVTMEGWPARDGSRYMRIRSVTRKDGSLVGDRAFAFDDE